MLGTEPSERRISRSCGKGIDTARDIPTLLCFGHEAANRLPLCDAVPYDFPLAFLALLDQCRVMLRSMRIHWYRSANLVLVENVHHAKDPDSMSILSESNGHVVRVRVLAMGWRMGGRVESAFRRLPFIVAKIHEKANGESRPVGPLQRWPLYAR